ncbi:MAG TPA: cation:proton antiporter [Acidimicrobiales bacterium]|nr:cation:proton antiporter [Acidimicrobiales bacterium]
MPLAGFVYLRHDAAALTLLGVAVVVVVGRLAGHLFERISQPRVIGEVVAGIALGPSLLGHLSNGLFPAPTRPLIGVLASFGLVVFMFLVGLELDLTILDGRHRQTSMIVAVWGTVLPFALGVLLALALHPTHHATDLGPFALFLGASMSITAFPVLARILQERGLYDKPLGVLAMASAACDDVLTWATLALVVAIVASTGAWAFPYICALAAVFCVVMVRVVRPLLARFGDRDPGEAGVVLAVAGVLACAFATATIGIHTIFGPFLLGAIFPRGLLATELRRRLTPVAAVLLPVFFVTTGLNVNLGGIGLLGAWQLPLILLVACSGKLAGATIGARSRGLPARESLALGVLMNTRGLTELVVLDIGRQLGVLDPQLFTLLVVMAVVTTVATAPLLRLVRPDPLLGEESVDGRAAG